MGWGREGTARVAQKCNPGRRFLSPRRRISIDMVTVHRMRYAWSGGRRRRKQLCMGRIPHEFRRAAALNMKRTGVPRSIAMALGGWRSESMYRRYAIASEADLRDGVRRLCGSTTKALEEAGKNNA